MKYTEYRGLASNTLAELGSTESNIQHMLVGMITEIGELLDAHKKNFAYGKELDMVNIKEEIGDFFWYVANFDNIYKKDVAQSSFMVSTSNSNSDNPIHALSSAMEYASKALSHLLTSTTELMVESYISSVIRLVVSDILWYCKYYNIDVEKIFDTNIAKLKTRYPNKFTQEDALNRDLKSERKILENGK